MKAPPTHGPVSSTWFSQRLRLHYVDWGNESAPPLLLLHGGRDHCRNWDWVAQRLRAQWHVIAPDLRGHGDSQWASDGHYPITNYVYDLAQLIHQLELAPLTLIAHSLGGNIALRYAGIYPENVARIVAIEGLGPSPRLQAQYAAPTVAGRMRKWIDAKRALASRRPRRYASLSDAFARMQQENKHLSPDQAWHLTRHGVLRNEDGSYSWKFDNHVRVWPPYDIPVEAVHELWSQIACPTLLVYGRESWASNPAEDGRLSHFRNAEVVAFDGAGHWVHHDRLEAFMECVTTFIAPGRGTPRPAGSGSGTG